MVKEKMRCFPILVSQFQQVKEQQSLDNQEVENQHYLVFC
jgi:hypothetical protein